MAVKLIMTWDISPERDQEYFEFVVREFIPGVQQLGFELSDAWATVYGDHPQIMVGALAPTENAANKLVQSAEWTSLINKLHDYVINYSQKIVRATGGFPF